MEHERTEVVFSLGDRWESVMYIQKGWVMVRLLHQQRRLSDGVISHMLSRNIRGEEDLVDQLFNSNEKSGTSFAARDV
jgi:hypothetical protein